MAPFFSRSTACARPTFTGVPINEILVFPGQSVTIWETSERKLLALQLYFQLIANFKALVANIVLALSIFIPDIYEI